MIKNATEMCLRATTPIRLVRILLPLVWGSAICWLSLTSSPPQISGFWGWDKLMHAGAYGLLALLVAQALILYINLTITYLLASALCVFYGVFIETLQIICSAGRTAEWLDVFANTVGAVVGCVIFRHLSVAIMRYDDVRGRTDG